MISSRAVKNLLATLFWVAAWYLLAVSMGNPLLLPTPVQVLRRLWELACTGQFWRITAVSIGRILLGAVSAMVLEHCLRCSPPPALFWMPSLPR